MWGPKDVHIYKGCHTLDRIYMQLLNYLVNMRLVILLVTVVGLVTCRPQDFKQNFQLANPIYITKYIYDLLPDQSYFYSYEQNDEQKKYERGSIRQGPTPEEDINTVEGSYSYVGPDGQNYNVTYTADENGFQPAGEHIPPSAGVKPKLGISSAALASLSG